MVSVNRSRHGPPTTPPRVRAVAVPVAVPVAVLVAVAVLLGLAGCAAPAGTPGAPLLACSSTGAPVGTDTVITATATSAEPAPRLPEGLRARLRESALTRTSTCVLVVGPDGAERSVDVTPRRPNGDLDHGPGRERKVVANLAALDGVLQSLAERRPGLDLLGALDAAVRRHRGPAVLFVVSSGVSTAGPADLRALGWDLEADREAARLAGRHELPDLSGWKVTFTGLGDTAGAQPPPGISLRERLGRWWTAVCRAAGAAECTADREVVSTLAPRSRNVVPPVPLPAAIVKADRVVIPGVLFTVGSAAIDPAAEAALQEVVVRCAASGGTVLVEGHTDAVTGTPSLNQQLSQARARSVADWLVTHGLPAERLGAVVGRGQSAADVTRERLDPRRIAADRKVEITFLPT